MQNKSVQSSRKHSTGKTLVGLTGLVAFVLLLNSILALFGLHRASQQHLSSLSKLREMMQALETARTAQVYFKKQVQEWKNALLRGQNPNDFQNYIDGFYSNERSVEQHLQELQILADKIGLDHAQIKNVQLAHKELGQKYRSALKSFDPNDPRTIFVVDRAVRGIDREPTEAMEHIVDRIWKHEEQMILQVQKDTASKYDTWKNILISGAAIGIFLVFILLWLSFTQSRV